MPIAKWPHFRDILNIPTPALWPKSGASNFINAFGIEMKNRVINGDMRVDQRNEGATLSVNSTAVFRSVDKWRGTGVAATGVYTLQRLSATPPAGFTNYLRAAVTTLDAAPANGSVYLLTHPVEGFLLQDAGLGLATASNLALSFWIRTSITGTFSGSLTNSAGTRCYVFSFVIGTASTWTKINLSIVGDVTGAWLVNSGIGMTVNIDLGCGATARGAAGSWVATANQFAVTAGTQLIQTNAATLDLTGVQLEVASGATAFDYLLIPVQLECCQRYYQKSFVTGVAPAQATGGSEIIGMAGRAGVLQVFVTWNFASLMRAAPTIVTFNPGAANAQIRDETGGVDCAGVATFNLTERNVTIIGTGNVATVVGSVLGVQITADADL